MTTAIDLVFEFAKIPLSFAQNLFSKFFQKNLLILDVPFYQWVILFIVFGAMTAIFVEVFE